MGTLPEPTLPFPYKMLGLCACAHTEMLATHKTHVAHFAPLAEETTHSLSKRHLSSTLLGMVKRPSKESQQKALKHEAYRLNISVSELKRLKSAGDGQERTSPLPRGDIIVSRH